MGSPNELDATRERWRLKAESLGLPDSEGAMPEPDGLARRFTELSTRLVVLPADPFRTDLQFDGKFWEWWGENRPAPFGGSVRWNISVPTTDAAVRAEGYGDRWNACLAVHRHGGVEVLSRDTYPLRDGVRAFRLTRIAALLWIGFDAQAWVMKHYKASGQWLVTLALRDTKGSFLGSVAEGWLEPHHMLADDAPRCLDANVLIRRELEEFPSEPDEIRGLAFDLGGRVEDAWGMKERRFIARAGKAAGEFDARGWDR